MEVHRQQCSACQSIDVRNIIVRKPGMPNVIYVRCLNCGKLVARYELSDYYHHGKGVESYLRYKGAQAAESGRQWLDDFQRIQQQAIDGYQEALKQLEEKEKDV